MLRFWVKRPLNEDLNRIIQSKFAFAECAKWATSGVISHFFVSSENLEGKQYLDFVSNQRNLALGAKFVKVNKKRIRKRALESFLKEKIFDSEILSFERLRHLQNSFNLKGKRRRWLISDEQQLINDEFISLLLEQKNKEMEDKTSICFLRFPVDREQFKQMSQNLFIDEDSVLYPLKDSSDRHFYKQAEALIKSHQNRVSKSKTQTAKLNSIDAQIKAELKKLKKMLRAQKAHERFGFSRIQKIFGWVRFADEPASFYKFEVSKHYLEIDVDSCRQVKVVQSELDLRTKHEFAKHPLMQTEDKLADFLHKLPEKSSVYGVDLNEREKSFFKCFIVGTNSVIKNQNKAFDFLERTQQSNKLSNWSTSLQNQLGLKNVHSKKEPVNKIPLNTKMVNPLLLRQFLTKSVHVPEFVAKDELDEDKMRELQVEYQEWGLENGDFFDGFLFRNEYGDPYKEHPSRSRNLLIGKTSRRCWKTISRKPILWSTRFAILCSRKMNIGCFWTRSLK